MTSTVNVKGRDAAGAAETARAAAPARTETETEAPPRTQQRSTLMAAWRLFVPLVAVMTMVAALTPHVRGIGFVMPLRLALLVPGCAIAALVAVALYRALRGRASAGDASGYSAARTRFWLALSALAGLLIAIVAIAGASASASDSALALAARAAPAILAGAALLAWRTARLIDAPPPRGRLRLVASTLVGLLALVAAVAALRGERLPPRGPDGMAFDIPRALFDVTHRFIDLPAGASGTARVHYVDEGAGETLLFLHGNPAWSFQWRELIAGLRGSYRCVALDYPGFGLSTAPSGYGFTAREQSQLVEAFIDRLGLRDVTLVMQDWGGPIGLGLAGRRPELVRRVILGNTWAWRTETRSARGLFSKIVGGPIGELAQMNFNGFARAAIANDAGPLPAETLEVYLRPFRALEGRRVAAFYPGQITAATDYFDDVEAGLPRLRHRPALLLWGMRDPGFPREDLDRFARTFPDHRTVELSTAGHFFFEDDPPRVVREIRAFLAETRQAGSVDALR